MTLVAVKLPSVDLDDLVNLPSTSATDQLSNVDPSTVFSPVELNRIRIAVAKASIEFDNDNVTEVAEQIAELSDQQLSTALFEGGFDNSTDFDFTIEQIKSMGSAISLQQPLSELQTQLNQVVDQLIDSLDDFSGQSFSSRSGLTTEQLVDLENNRAGQIVANVEQNATDAENAIRQSLQTSADDQTISSVQKIVSDGQVVFTETINREIERLKSSISDRLAQIESATAAVADQLQSILTDKTNNITVQTQSIDKIAAVSEGQLLKVKTKLLNDITESKLIISDKAKATVRTQSIAAVVRHKQNNPDADVSTLINHAKSQNNRATEQYQLQAEAALAAADLKTKQTKAILDDIKNASEKRLLSPVLAGRPVPSRVAVLEAVNSSSNQLISQPEFFVPSSYRTSIAKSINSLHPSLRKRFQDALIDFLARLYDYGYDIDITSATRSIERQRALFNKLQPTGAVVAQPGNSWHNYGCAIDVVLYIDGIAQPKSNSSAYNGLVAPSMIKHQLINPFERDPIHFQPVEFPLSPASIKQNLVDARGQINSQAIDRLIIT